MAAQSNLKNMVLCLSIVCLVCSALLAVVYAVTYDPIQEASRKAVAESIGKVLPEGVELASTDPSVASLDGRDYEYYTSADGAFYAVKSSETGFGGPLVIMVGVRAADLEVWNTAVLEKNETPGLGAKCDTDPKFLANWSYESRQASGKVLDAYEVGVDVDAITASTITSRAYAKAVKAAVEVVKNLGGQSNE